MEINWEKEKRLIDKLSEPYSILTFFSNWKNYGLKGALRLDWGRTKLNHCRERAVLLRMYRQERKAYNHAVKAGLESGYYIYESPLEFEIERKRVHQRVTRIFNKRRVSYDGNK